MKILKILFCAEFFKIFIFNFNFKNGPKSEINHIAQRTQSEQALAKVQRPARHGREPRDQHVVQEHQHYDGVSIFHIFIHFISIL